MDSNLPSIIQLLNIIDPEKEIDREKVMVEIGSLNLLGAISRVGEHLSESGKTEIKDLMASGLKADMIKIFEVFKKEEKYEELIKVIETEAEALKTEYIKTQMGALDDMGKQKVYAVYPQLKAFVEKVG